MLQQHLDEKTTANLKNTLYRPRLNSCRKCLIRPICLSLVLTATSLALAQPEFSFEPDGGSILTRGPVHEAFAEPIAFNPEPGRLAPAAPPEPIQELPPDYQPEGINIDWIPGYWAWDDEINSYIWISGIWRDIPPGREWIAGYWIQSVGGFRWIPGFWADADNAQRLYLPEPPDSVETGPNYDFAPSVEHVWISGTWVWYEQRYAWRPGHWVQGRPDWIWVPAHYVWTPRGYVFVNGYWDYDLDRRGVLFAPVRFERQHYERPRFSYKPQTVIDISIITDHLFLRSNHYHYYFGDYYDDRYAKRGYRPWFSAHKSSKVYDPIYVHRRWRNRNDGDWDGRLRRDFDHRRRNQNARPPHSWADQQRFTQRRDGDRDRDRDRGGPDRRGDLISGIAKTLGDLVNRDKSPIKFKRIDDDQRRRFTQRRDDVQQIRSQRLKVEGRTDGKPDRRYETRTRPHRAPGYNSGIASKPITQLGGSNRPPKRPDTPKVDAKVQPQKRQKAKIRDQSRRDDRDKDRRKDRDNDRDKDRGRDRDKDRDRD